MATPRDAAQIVRVPHPAAAPPPYALVIPVFRHRALAALAARAPIGPSRDVALAWFVCARLIEGNFSPAPLSGTARSARAAAARSWLATAGLPTTCRLPLGKLMDACGADGDPDYKRIGRAAADALAASAEHLDAAAKGELEALARL